MAEKKIYTGTAGDGTIGQPISKKVYSGTITKEAFDEYKSQEGLRKLEQDKPLFEAAGALGVDTADLFMPKLPSVFDQVKQNPNMPRELPKQRTSEEINQEIVNRINNKLAENETSRQEIINFDAVAAEDEIANLQTELDISSKYAEEIINLKNQIEADELTFSSLPQNDAYRVELKNRINKNKAKYYELNKKYGGEKVQTLRKSIAEKKIALTQKKRLQELLKNNDTAVNDPEFAKYVKSGKETLWQDVGKVVGASGGSVPRDLYDDLGAAAWALYKRNNPGAQIPLYADLRNAEIFLEQMKDEEFDLLAYYIGKDKETGGNQAETYVELMKETLQNRKGQEIYEQYLKDNTVLEVLYGVPAGLDQFANGVTSLFNFKDDYIPASPVQVAGSLAREDLADDSIPLWYNFNDGKWENEIFGASLGQMAYDSVQTTANMAPSIAASTLIGLINPTAGAVTGGVLMGGSAAGNAYQEALNNGWGKTEARTYSTLIGASEALLSAIISKVFGGKLVSDAVENAIKGVTNGFARFSLNYGAAFVSEGLEEAAQEVLSPLFENIAFGYNRKGFEDIDWAEVAYSFLLGGLSGGMFETAGSGVKQISSVASVMKEYNTPEKTQNLLKLALSFPAESKANKLATKYNEQVKSNGKLSANKVYNLVAATENVVTERLTKLGETGNIPAIASAVVKAVTTGQLTTKEKAVLQSSQHGAELLKEINVTEEVETHVLQSNAKNNDSSVKNSVLTQEDLDAYLKVGKKQHTRNKKTRMLESGKKPILTSALEIKNFILDVIKGRALGEVRAFGKVGKRLAEAIMQKRSSLNLEGKYLELNADDLREAYKRHSSPKEKGDIPLTEDDFVNIPEYIDEFDYVLGVNEYNGKIEIHLATETEDGYVKILTVSSKERDSLQVSKIIGISKEKFNEKYGKKIERDTGSLRGLSDESENSNPSTTAQLTAGTLSNDIIDEKPPGVKNIISDSGENYSDSQPAGVSGKNIGVSGNIFGASGQDSGVRHHTSKAEQEYIKRICDALGVKMQFVHITSKLMAKYGYNISEDSLPDGFYDKDSQTLYIGFTGYDPVKFVFKHELTHFGEGTESYKNFVDAVNESKAFKEWLVKQYGKDAENLSTAALEGKVIQQYVDRRKAYEPNFKPEDAKAEMVADFVGRCLFDNDTAALERMVSNLDYKQAETIWQHIKEFFAYLKRKLSGEKDLVWEITRLENQFNRMLSEAVQTKKATEQSGGIKFDIKKSTDGNKYVQVDGGKIETESANDIAKILSNIVRNKFNDFIDVSGQKIGINGKTAREWQRSKDAQYLLANEKQKFADKLSAFENADELLKSARDYIGEEIKHIRKDNFKEFARGVVDFKVDDRGYSADIIVGTTKTNVAILYDIVHLQEKEIEDASHTTQGRRAETSSNDIILNEESSVKNNIPDNDANNSDSGLKFTFSRALNNEKIQKAEAMEKELEGENDKRYRDMLIWEETGLIRDPSGVWVYEIDDGKMRFYPKGDRFKKRKEPRGKNLLKNYIRHKELFERYPQLNNTELVVYDFKGTGTRGSYLPEFNCIMLDKTYIETASVEEVASTLIHEIQHAAQHFDERESGANIEYWNQRLKLGTMPKNPKTGKEYTPYEAYRATRGEYEARMSSERLWMDSDEKKETFGAPFYDPENTVSTNVELAGAKPSSLKFSVPTDREYLKSVESGDNKILQQMVDNKAKAEGYTERLYHQTGADFTEFNTDNQKAGKYDWELPTGMFLKPSNDDIGLKGKKQMDLYAKQRNPLNFRDRAEAQQYWRDNVEGYDEAADKILSIDSEYRLKSDAASYEVQSYMKHWRLENPNASRQAIYNDARFQELHDKEALIFEEWEAESDKASIAAKKLIDNYIAESDYDGVVLENDVGAMGRQTKTYIVFDSSQLKDASPVTYDDSGNVIPLSERFNGDKKDIRFSIPNVLSSEEMLEAYEKGEISRQDYLNSLSNNKTLNPVEISDLTKEDANTTPKLKRKTGVSDGNKVSKFYGSVLESKIFDLEFKAEIMQDTFVEKYKSVTNKETLQRAADELDTGGRAYVNRWWTIDPAHASLIDTAVGLILMDRYQRVGDYDSAAAVTEKVREFGTSGGQQIQLFSILGRLSPETMALYAQRELDKAFEILAKDKAQKWIDQNQEKFKLSEEDIKFIREYTVLAALFDENTRQKAVLLGEISARVQNKMPPQKGDSIRAFQRNAMLLNPKTQIRNIVGNGGMVPVFIASDIIGSGIDKMLAKKTGIRTTGNFNVKSLKGVKKGLYESYDDFKLGIRTKQEELNRFDVNVKHGGKSFNDNSNGLFGTGTLKKQLNAVARGLNKIDNFTSFCLEAGDRPFFEMWYMNSLNTQMKLNNVDIPTTEMMEVARQEALQRTWQDDNTFTKSVSNLKRILNNLVHLPNSNYGLGDFVLKFVKTPSNLAKAIIEFSPAGLVSTWSNAKKLKNAIETNRFTPQLQKEYVRSLSNAITGTLIYTIIGIGAALGLVKLSGDGDDDKDASNFEKYIMGIPPYSIEFFGVPIAYDWMQPFGSILATVAEFMENRETNSELDIGDAVWEAVCAGGKTFTQQSFLQSMYEFFSGDDIIDGLVNIALAEPAAFVPQAFSQVASFTDKYRRTSYDSNSNFQTAINKIIAKIPVLRTTLPKQVNSLGEDVKNPQYFKEALGAWNAFASPWNTYPKSSKEVVGEIYKLYKDSGETSVMPRMAPNYFERSGVRINLTPEEKANFQRSMGDRSVQMLVQLFNSKEYTNLTDQQKVDIVSKIYSYSYARAKSEYDYDFETLSDILGENEDGEPILTKERYDRMSDENKKKVIEELFLSKTEIKYLDDYKKLVDYYIRKAED